MGWQGVLASHSDDLERLWERIDSLEHRLETLQVMVTGHPTTALFGIWVKSDSYEGWLRDGSGRVVNTADYRLAQAELATGISQCYWEMCEIRRIDEWAFEQRKKTVKGEANADN